MSKKTFVIVFAITILFVVFLLYEDYLASVPKCEIPTNWATNSTCQDDDSTYK